MLEEPWKAQPTYLSHIQQVDLQEEPQGTACHLVGGTPNCIAKLVANGQLLFLLGFLLGRRRKDEKKTQDPGLHPRTFQRQDHPSSQLCQEEQVGLALFPPRESSLPTRKKKKVFSTLGTWKRGIHTVEVVPKPSHPQILS